MCASRVSCASWPSTTLILTTSPVSFLPSGVPFRRCAKHVADTNVGGGLWSTVEVQVGFICANLPHTRPLVIRWYQRWRPRGLVRSSTSDYPDSYITQTHRSHPSHRHDTLGFQSLDSDGKAVGQDTETLGGGEQAYTGGLGEGSLDPEVGGIRAPGERIKVRTEVRQEVQRMGSPGPLKLKKCWRNDTVSTEISAKA